ncbi:MAG: hypothetical protein ACLVDB_04840 [Anaeromassilibacillus sp.]
MGTSRPVQDLMSTFPLLRQEAKRQHTNVLSGLACPSFSIFRSASVHRFIVFTAMIARSIPNIFQTVLIPEKPLCVFQRF